ncbi:MAG: hypothetical protein A2132_06265 [Nitrospirae bacterium RBG_16_43_11]|nr:MAG: hypothetical protein A2132_06265 [Nitrospirae bacterium RBG_16_43_11]HJW87062.1 hypothetical protein [Candidatus Brocadiaceae bacterium]
MRINKAAKALNRSPSTVRRWIQQGAPTVRLGSVGRDNGSLVNIADIQRWRGGGAVTANDDELLARLAIALLDTIRRDEIHISVNISERDAASLLVLVYQRYYRNLTNEQVDIDNLPDEMKHICAFLL